MKYAYEDLSPEQFETLVVLICKVLLGAGVQGFAKGPDGGRDAKFVGTAQLYPSTASPWSGPVIAQAKHTIGYNKSFGESDFFTPTGANTVIAEETPRIIALRAAGELDNVPYKVQFSTFTSGPPQVEAATAGGYDVSVSEDDRPADVHLRPSGYGGLWRDLRCPNGLRHHPETAAGRARASRPRPRSWRWTLS